MEHYCSNLANNDCVTSSRDSHFQENIGDRFGFHHVMMSVSLWPTILIMIADVWRDKRPITRDVEDRLYSKLAYLVTKVSNPI